MRHQIKNCGKKGVYCSLWEQDPNEQCLAMKAYDLILNQLYPFIGTLPIGRESLKLRWAIQRVICRSVIARQKKIKRDLQLLERNTND